jgi:hypothetical protein
MSKDRTVKTLGPNPFEYVGVTFSADGTKATLWEKGWNDWEKYNKIDGSTEYECKPVPQEYCGKGFNLSTFCHVFNWVTGDGYNNFSSWVR